MKNIFLLALLSILSIKTNSQTGYFSQDPCMAELMNKGCTEVYETKEYADPAFLPFCPKMKVRITLSKLVCNGKVVSMHIWSAGAWAPDCKGGSGTWDDLKSVMQTAVDNYASSLISSMGLDHVLVSTGSVCKAEVTFEMPQFYTNQAYETPTGSGSVLTLNQGGKYTFTLPCKSDNCCYGYADVVDNKVVGVTPSANPMGGGCPTPLSNADVMDWFKQTFQVANGGEKKMFNIVISPCEEKCELSNLIGDSEGVWLKSAAKPMAGQKLDYNVTIESIKDASLTFKSDILPTNYQILDINGRVLENKLIQSNIIDIKPLAKGIFFFKANYGNGISSVVKFVKD